MLASPAALAQDGPTPLELPSAAEPQRPQSELDDAAEGVAQAWSLAYGTYVGGVIVIAGVLWGTYRPTPRVV